MVAYPYQMPSGIAGNVTRPDVATIEQFILDQTTTPTGFGLPVKIVSGKLQPIGSGDVASSIVGFLARPYPTSGNGTDGLGVASPNKALPGDLLKRGYINVVVNGSTAPASGGKVYTRVGNASSGKPLGGIEAASEAALTASATTGTGTSTAGTLSATDATPADTYTVTLTATSSTAAFNVTDGKGQIVGTGKIGTQTNLDNGLSFEITAGGTPTTGDYLTISVAQNTVVVPGNTYFTGTVDTSGNGEVAFNI